MSIDIKTTAVRPVRTTFDHIAERLGEGKVPSRYQEAVLGLQPLVNFHYRPTWDPEHQLYDPRRTAIEMDDWDSLLDPRQYYYGTYTIQRARQQDSQEANFSFVEKRALLDSIEPQWREKINHLVIPLRHVAWGANTNNCYIAAYGMGAPITSAATMQTTDQLGVAQYVTRIGLILGGNEPTILDQAKTAWMDDPMWQPLRKLVEDSMVTKDWFELHVLQNFLIDGAVHPLVFDHFDAQVAKHGGSAFAMLTEFMSDWFVESQRWTDATIKVAAQASADNKTRLEAWLTAWAPRVREAVTPLAQYGLGDTAVLDEIFGELTKRAAKIGLKV